MSDQEPEKIVGVARIDNDAVIVEYSNNTSAIYTVDQLLALKPKELITESSLEEDEE
ncbi:MAG TPA: hypothetical protein VHW46_13925 [Terracidiphilus sp.]|nr:hypothetical protein [Terracidiphilus sp.]